MYDKILRHRHTIEAHLAEAEHGSSGRGDNAAVRLELLDHNQLLVYADSQPDLDKANKIIGSVINEGDLGLTGLTSLAKMAANSGTTAVAAAVKVPLGNAASWDAATRPRDIDEATKQLLESALPQEIGVHSPSQWILPSHTQVTRAASDSYVQHMQQVMVDFSRLVVAAAPTSTTMTTSSSEASTNRRKLESEDSSYGSDNEHPKDSIARRPIATAQVWNGGGGSGGSGHNGSHEDISRTVSETLGVEFSEYVDHYESIEDVTRDKLYESNLVFALKLGYTEPQLQKALLKLGKKAREDQILEELIRIQKSSKATAMSDDPLLPSDQQTGCDSKRLHHQQHAATSSLVGAICDKSHAEIDAMQSNETRLLLPIIIDGSNVAMSHGNKEGFSCRGIKICVDWFRSRGHKEITVFVPMWRKESSKPEAPTTDKHILTELEKEKKLSFTPSRQVNGKRYVCHDDRYILNLAAENGGIVVSNDNYRELINEKPKFKEVIEERILMYSFVNDRFMPPDDPLGKNGPTLDQFLRKKVKLPCPLPQPCPYGKKCTYGNKCKFYHPDRATNQKSITDKLKEHSSVRINEVRARVNSRDSSPGDSLTRTRSMQPKQDNAGRPKQAVSRTKSSVPRLEHHHWGSAATGQGAQQNWPPVFDTSMPPPPPRTPWNPEQGSSQNTHTKLSRQYSVNPNYDPRIHNSSAAAATAAAALPPKQDFSYPPPPFPNPSTHLTVTRNASEPDPYMVSNTPNTVIQQQAQLVSSTTAPQSHRHEQAELCKTWSSPVVNASGSGGSSTVAAAAASASSSGAVSPFFGLPRGGVWETSRPHGDVRSKLYYYLAKLFDEDAVIRAMASLPHETDPKVICNLIISMESSATSTTTAGNAQI